MSFIIGIAGTAKNTGKTTTTSTILNELRKNNIKIGLTGIGYDGEELDNITGLPKPRLLLKKGMIVATAQKCLSVGTAGFNVLETTDISTPLGKVIIIEVTQEGLVVIAGPNKGRELRLILDKMTRFSCDFIIVDGALNRIAPMVETDGLILATGAARNSNINQLVEETIYFYKIFNLPSVTKEEKDLVKGLNKITLIERHQKNYFALDYAVLIDKTAVSQIVSKIFQYNTIYVPSLISQSSLKELSAAINKSWKGKTLIVKDSIKLATGGTPYEVYSKVEEILSFGGNIKVEKSIPIIAISVNPFYPKYRFDINNYEPGFIDSKELYFSMRNAVPTTVVDVKRYGCFDLIKAIKSFYKPRE